MSQTDKPIAIARFHDLVALLEEHPEWRAELRRLGLSEELLRLAGRIEALFRTYEESSRELMAWRRAALEE